jgi:hypothetical protein
MTQMDDDAPQLLGPGGELLGSSGGAQEVPSDESATPTDAASDAVVAEGPAFHVSAVLAVPPQVTMATLIAMMNHDPMKAYKRRLEAARPQFEQSREVLIAAAEARLMSQSPEGDHRPSAIRYVDQGFMAELWDMCFETVSGAQVSIIFSARVAGPEHVASTILSSNAEVPGMWVTTRALQVGDRFGVWAAPVMRDQPMPATVPLSADNFQQLRINYARVQV